MPVLSLCRPGFVTGFGLEFQNTCRTNGMGPEIYSHCAKGSHEIHNNFAEKTLSLGYMYRQINIKIKHRPQKKQSLRSAVFVRRTPDYP